MGIDYSKPNWGGQLISDELAREVRRWEVEYEGYKRCLTEGMCVLAEDAYKMCGIYDDCKLRIIDDGLQSEEALKDPKTCGLVAQGKEPYCNYPAFAKRFRAFVERHNRDRGR